MIAVFGFLGLALFQSTTPPDISGHWTGEGWGQVELKQKQPSSYDGTYTDTFGNEKGKLKLEWSRIEGRFKGTWGEGKDRFGKISVRLVDKEIRGAWTTSKKSRIESGTPELADLVWARHDPFQGNVALSSRGATVEGVDSHPQTLLDGKTTGYHGTRGWARSLTPATWTVTLPREYPLQQIRLLLYDRDSRKFHYTIETSTDGKKYEVVADRSKEWARSWQIHSFSKRTVRYIRVQCLNSSYNDRPREDGFFAVELEAYCHPPKPSPRFPGGPLPGRIDDLNKRSYMLQFSGRHETHMVVPKLRYDGSHPITFEATVMSLYRGSIIGDFNGSGLGLTVADGYCTFHVNDGRAADNGYASIKSGTRIRYRVTTEQEKPVHVAGVLDGSELRLFVNGKLEGKETIGEFNKSKFPFMIGADPGGEGEPTQFLQGIIDEVRVSKTARYREDFSPPSRFESDEDTLVLYRFDEGEGSVANDASGNSLHAKIHSPKWIAAKAPERPVYSVAIQQLRKIGVNITEKNGAATEFAIGNSARITDDDLAAFQSLAGLENLTLINCKNVTDAGFAHLKHLSRLQKLNLSPSNITDAGLANVKGLQELGMLGLNSTRVTDAGLQHLVDNRKIAVLYLNNTKITDDGLTFLEQMKDMYWMDLGGTAITDVGLAYLGHMSKMKLLSVDGTRVTDDGLKHLARFPELELINLNRTAVTDAGVAHLVKLRSLKRLLLSDTQITFACLDHLAKMKHLKELQLLNTQIPPACIEELRERLPKDCQILHSFTPQATTLQGHENHVNSAVFSPDGKILAAGDYAGKVFLWDVATQEKLRSLNVGQPIECVDFSPDGRTLVTADRGHAITFWNVKTGRHIKRLKEHTSAVMSVTYSPEGTMLASAGVDNAVKIWDSASGKVRTTLSGHKNAIQEVVFSPDETKLASVEIDGVLKIWNPVEGELLRTLQVDRSGMGLAFSPDGKILATANYPPKIQLFDVATGKVLGTFMGHKNRVRDVAFSPNGRVLTSAGDDQTIRLWDMESRQQIGILSGHTGRVHDVEFSPDGKTLASGSADRTSKLWNVESYISGKKKHSDKYAFVAVTLSGKKTDEMEQLLTSHNISTKVDGAGFGNWFSVPADSRNKAIELLRKHGYGKLVDDAMAWNKSAN